VDERRVVGLRADGHRLDGLWVDELRVDGHRLDGHWADRYQTDGHWVDGLWVDRLVVAIDEQSNVRQNVIGLCLYCQSNHSIKTCL